MQSESESKACSRRGRVPGSQECRIPWNTGNEASVLTSKGLFSARRWTEGKGGLNLYCWRRFSSRCQGEATRRDVAIKFDNAMLKHGEVQMRELCVP